MFRERVFGRRGCTLFREGRSGLPELDDCPHESGLTAAHHLEHAAREGGCRVLGRSDLSQNSSFIRSFICSFICLSIRAFVYTFLNLIYRFAIKAEFIKLTTAPTSEHEHARRKHMHKHPPTSTHAQTHAQAHTHQQSIVYQARQHVRMRSLRLSN